MRFKPIASYSNYLPANMTLGILQENEINCFLSNTSQDQLSALAVGSIKLLVAETDFEKAQTLIKKAEEDYLKDIACPNCNVHTLTMEEKITKPQSFWHKLKNQIAYGQPDTYSKQYLCTNCKKVFTELPLSF